ncbi:hypothetical protein D0Z08_31100 [Nocardioides immobilis]|uniref:Uncharacterized protein n=1 Tax=Nocardioides immobilis TaxID=2049295 RepID=A0A417XS80_9ACTN|nr:hypothetical protein [Nocardioides immobilis]RHW22791.1 hypothetical protein D0Z08_31100 [Nocardioides immobilis]
MTESTQASAPGVGRVAPDPPHPPRLDELRTALVLQREADAMIAEALDTRRSAIERAETLVREAQQATARAEEDAAAAAAKRIAAAREQADCLIAEAEERAHRITSEAQAEVTALRQDAAELRDCAMETLDAAELGLERARQTEENRERQLLVTRSEAIRMIESLEHVTATLDEMLEHVRSEVASARRALAQLDGDAASAVDDEPVPSVVLQWPHAPATTTVADPATTDASEAIQTSKHRRAEHGGRRGRLRKART